MSKPLTVARLFSAKEISADDPLPQINDPNWISTKQHSPFGTFRGKSTFVWAKDSKDFVFKAFYFSGLNTINGFWNASPTLDSHEFGEIVAWMPYQKQEEPPK